MESKFWWIENSIPENESRSGCLRASVVAKYRNFSKMRVCVWKWFRTHAGRKDLTPGSKIVLWSICERYRAETMSSHDAYAYYAKMVGLSRNTVGACVSELVDRGILWIALENERTLVRKAKAGVRKHILLVGLGVVMIEQMHENERS